MTAKRRRWPIWARLALSFLAVALGALVLLTALVLGAATRDLTRLLEEEQDQTMEVVADALAGAWSEAAGWNGTDLEPALAIATAGGAHTTVRDSAGRIVAETPTTPGTGRSIASPVTVGDVGAVGSVQLTFASGGLPSPQRHLRDALVGQVAVSAGLAALLALTVSVIVSRRITRPLSILTSTVERMATGDRLARVGTLDASGELRQLSATFDQMADAVAREDGLRRALTADIAHELRTPLTILQGTLEALVEGVVEATPAQLASLHDEAMRLTRIIADFETLAAADAAALTLRREPADLADVARRAVASLAPQFAAAGLHVSSQLCPVEVEGDADRLRQVVTNLLTNALKFTPSGGEVIVTVERAAGGARLVVSDTGVGVDADDLPRVFDRFWRGGEERDAFGSGVGLTVVAELVRAHGGDVSMDSEPGRGTAVTVTLPSR